MSADVHVLVMPCMLDDKCVDSLMAVGGMGAVFRGSHTKLQKTVAIKVLKRERIGSTELVERFQREAVAASQIGHEGSIEVTDIGTSSLDLVSLSKASHEPLARQDGLGLQRAARHRVLLLES